MVGGGREPAFFPRETRACPSVRPRLVYKVLPKPGVVFGLRGHFSDEKTEAEDRRNGWLVHLGWAAGD